MPDYFVRLSYSARANLRVAASDPEEAAQQALTILGARVGRQDPSGHERAWTTQVQVLDVVEISEARRAQEQIDGLPEDGLARAARGDPDLSVRVAAAGSRQLDVRVALELALYDVDCRVRLAALGRLNDPNDLAEAAARALYPDVRRAACERITDVAVLEQLATADSSREVRASASHRLAQLRASECKANGDT